MANDPDSTEPGAADPATLAEVLPDSDRGQGVIADSTADGIAEAAAEGVDLTDDGTGVVARSAGTGTPNQTT